MSARQDGLGLLIGALIVGLLVGYFVRPLITDEESITSSADPETVVETVIPSACIRAINDADELITAQAQSLVNEKEDAIDVATRAFELGQQNDEDEFIAGLIRSQADSIDLARVVASDLSNYGWAGDRILRGNDAKVCLGIEE